MKTIIAIFIGKNGLGYRGCPYNTDLDLHEGDLFRYANSEYKMKIAEVLPESFVYYNRKTKELSNKINSTDQIKIKRLQLMDNDVVPVHKDVK